MIATSKSLTPSNVRVLVACILLAAVSLMAFGSYRVHQQHQIVKLGYELREARSELRDLQEEERRLSLESAVLTNPKRVEELATSLGMVRPGPEQLRRIPRHGQQGTASAARAPQYWALANDEARE